jgi:hypothetical protein
MRITKHQLVAGYSAVKVRAFLRRYRVGMFKAPAAEDAFQVNVEEAAELLAQLVALGLIEPVGPKTVLSESGFELTSRGEAFANASAAKPVFRKTAKHYCSSSWSASTLLIPILTTLTGSKAPFFSAACSLKQSGWEMCRKPAESGAPHQPHVSHRVPNKANPQGLGRVCSSRRCRRRPG